MKKIVVLLAIVGMLFHFKQDIENFFSPGLFDENGQSRIVIFTKPDCGKPCDQAVNDLNARGVDYEELDINLNQPLLNEIGLPRSLPFLVVGNDKYQGFNQGFYSSMLAKNFGNSVLLREEQAIYSQHFDEAGNPKVVLYGTDWCGYCKKLRRDFADNNIEFLDYDVEKPYKQTRLLKTLGITGYPTVFVGFNRVNGFDIQAIKKVL